ncbi:MAG TPA: hypothetical protein VEC19_02960 [Usitatibacter sp.]|nr:hypothetical protein [Usitatibacter sp.]
MSLEQYTLSGSQLRKGEIEMKRKRRDEDSEIAEILGPFRRAAATASLGLVLGLGWVVCAIVGAAEAGVAAPVVRLFTTVFGWGALGLLSLSIVRFSWAYLRLRFPG